MDRETRRRLGAWYTPPSLVSALVEAVLATTPRAGGALRVLDPACGDGRFLAEASRQLAAAGVVADLTGVDVDPGAVAAARAALPSARIVHGDSLARDWGDEHFDVVVGNPPFRGQLSAVTSRGGRSVHGGGAYADAAAEFLALSSRLACADGGRVGLVLPLSMLGARDAGPIRAEVSQRGSMRWLWWCVEAFFPDASVHTCAVVFENGAPPAPVVRCSGPGFTAMPPAGVGDGDWTELLADGLGVPALGPLAADGVLGDHAGATADFREQFYGLVGAVGDDLAGPPLVTSGLIDAGVCWWGERAVRFAGARYEAPRVDVTRLTPRLQRWARARLVPKVLVASQTRAVEAVVDPSGEWLPGVPVVTVVARRPEELWAVGAVLTSPVASAWITRRAAGTGRSGRVVRVSAAALHTVPWPAGPLGAAEEALRAGAVHECARAVLRAYGLEPDRDGAALLRWWEPLAVR
jgi:SAM-dependent methyltransferase